MLRSHLRAPALSILLFNNRVFVVSVMLPSVPSTRSHDAHILLLCVTRRPMSFEQDGIMLTKTRTLPLTSRHNVSMCCPDCRQYEVHVVLKNSIVRPCVRSEVVFV